MKKTDIPARHDGPMACISSTITVAACRGAIHRKCRYKVTCKSKARLWLSKQAAANALMSTV